MQTGISHISLGIGLIISGVPRVDHTICSGALKEWRGV